MIETDFMLKGLEQVTGIKVQRDKHGFVNMSQFMDEYRKKYPNEFKDRFGDESGDDVLQQFLNERFGNHEEQ